MIIECHLIKDGHGPTNICTCTHVVAHDPSGYLHGHPRNEEISLNQNTMHGSSYSVHREEYKNTPELRTPPLIRTLKTVPRVSGIEGFHTVPFSTCSIE